jgi:aspartate/methionine/tyrosine aminotransferase
MRTLVVPQLRQQLVAARSVPLMATVAGKSLTEQEVAGFQHVADLSNGHAYHELPTSLATLPDEMPALWRAASRQTPIEWEKCFIDSFVKLSGVNSLRNLAFCRPCPTASNSIDLCAALLRRRGWVTALVEPTFDNLALLLRRREVALYAISENMIFEASLQVLEDWLRQRQANALFLVSPSNPSGRCLSPQRLHMISALCTRLDVTLVLDCCFRLFNRAPYDDLEILLNSKTRFIAFEDTGKVLPTLDTKASLIYASDDLAADLEELFNEVYLCNSGISLALLTRCFDLMRAVGLEASVWRLVDQRRSRLRAALPGTGLRVAPESVHSVIGLEWLAFDTPEFNDLQVCALLETYGLVALSGRQFYWSSSHDKAHQYRIRFSMMKEEYRFSRALKVLGDLRVNGGLF